MQNYGFGVDIGGTTCKLGRFTTKGELLEKWEIPTSKKENGAYILEDVAETITQNLMENQIDKEQVVGIGLDVPGPVGGDGIVSQCVNLGWQNYPAAELLRKRMGMKVCICNDANAAALGEMWQGGGSGYRNMVMVTLGTGVGGAVILDGKIVPGIHGIAGELGHITVNPKETVPCNCGKYGCLEQYASATGLVRTVHRYQEETKTKTDIFKAGQITAKDVLEAAKAGDLVAGHALELLGETLGRTLAATSHVIDPEIYVVGGGVSKAGDILLTTVKKYFEKEVLPAGRNTKFALATLGNDAGIYGAMRMLME